MFIKEVKEKYYSKHFPELGEEELKEVIFATQPSNGAFGTCSVSFAVRFLLTKDCNSV